MRPLAATAAHAGLPRSELVRVRKYDVDIDFMILTVRELELTKGKQTTRRVPRSTALAAILREWLAGHSRVPFLFAQSKEVFRSKKRRRTTGPATVQKAEIAQRPAGGYLGPGAARLLPLNDP